MNADEQIFHESIHADSRQELADVQWALKQERGRGKVKDSIIAELTKLLETATNPGE
jgi:hypothetical protein